MLLKAGGEKKKEEQKGKPESKHEKDAKCHCWTENGEAVGEEMWVVSRNIQDQMTASKKTVTSDLQPQELDLSIT